MVTQEILKEKINESAWDSLNKERAFAILPQLGKHSIEFLYITLGLYYGHLVIGGILDTFSMFILGTQNLLSGKSREIIGMLEEAPEVQEWDYGQYFLPLVLDYKQLVRLGKIQDKDFKIALNNFILVFYDQLPEDEINAIYQGELLFFMDKLKVLDELKLLAYGKDLSDLFLWSGQFLQSLQKNEEKIGIKDIVTNGQVHQPTIGNWIVDFLTNSPQAAQGEPTLAQVDYLHKSINVKNLVDSDRELLTEVLKLYCWCLQPEINEKEIQEYIALKEKDEEEIDVPQVNIDEKLVELKDRKDKSPF
jgi:hypothetical protein